MARLLDSYSFEQLPWTLHETRVTGWEDSGEAGREDGMTRANVLVAVLLIAACGPLPTSMEIDEPIVGTWMHLSSRVNEQYFFSQEGLWTRSLVTVNGVSPLTLQEPGGDYTLPEARDLKEFWTGSYRLVDGRLILNVEWYQLGSNVAYKFPGDESVTLTCIYKDDHLYLDTVEFGRTDNI